MTLQGDILKAGDMCIARFKSDGLEYEAKIIKVTKDGPSATVKYNDGITKLQKSNTLRKHNPDEIKLLTEKADRFYNNARNVQKSPDKSRSRRSIRRQTIWENFDAPAEVVTGEKELISHSTPVINNAATTAAEDNVTLNFGYTETPVEIHNVPSTSPIMYREDEGFSSGTGGRQTTLELLRSSKRRLSQRYGSKRSSSPVKDSKHINHESGTVRFVDNTPGVSPAPSTPDYNQRSVATIKCALEHTFSRSTLEISSSGATDTMQLRSRSRNTSVNLTQPEVNKPTEKVNYRTPTIGNESALDTVQRKNAKNTRKMEIIKYVVAMDNSFEIQEMMDALKSNE